MKKSERKILEKNIITVVEELFKKHNSKAAEKTHKALKQSAKELSKKFYKSTKIAIKPASAKPTAKNKGKK